MFLVVLILIETHDPTAFLDFNTQVSTVHVVSHGSDVDRNCLKYLYIRFKIHWYDCNVFTVHIKFSLPVKPY